MTPLSGSIVKVPRVKFTNKTRTPILIMTRVPGDGCPLIKKNIYVQVPRDINRDNKILYSETPSCSLRDDTPFTQTHQVLNPETPRLSPKDIETLPRILFCSFKDTKTFTQKRHTFQSKAFTQRRHTFHPKTPSVTPQLHTFHPKTPSFTLQLHTFHPIASRPSPRDFALFAQDTKLFTQTHQPLHSHQTLHTKTTSPSFTPNPSHKDNKPITHTKPFTQIHQAFHSNTPSRSLKHTKPSHKHTKPFTQTHQALHTNTPILSLKHTKPFTQTHQAFTQTHQALHTNTSPSLKHPTLHTNTPSPSLKDTKRLTQRLRDTKRLTQRLKPFTQTHQPLHSQQTLHTKTTSLHSDTKSVTQCHQAF